MSAAPLEPGQGGEAMAFDWAGAVTSGIVGAAAMLARLLTLERASFWFVLRSSIIAIIASYFVGQATRHLFSPEQQGLWIVTVGLAGFGSPELLTYLIKRLPDLLPQLLGRFGLGPANNAKGKTKRRKRRG